MYCISPMIIFDSVLIQLATSEYLSLTRKVLYSTEKGEDELCLNVRGKRKEDGAPKKTRLVRSRA